MTSSICAALEASIRAVPDPAGFPVGGIAAVLGSQRSYAAWKADGYHYKPAELVLQIGHLPKAS